MLSLALLLSGVCWGADGGSGPGPKSMKPLAVGENIPSGLSILTATGTPYNVDKALRDRRSVIVFFRGGWSPSCMTMLKRLQLIENQLFEDDFQILAICADKPSHVSKNLVKAGVGYIMLSDPVSKSARAFGVAEELDRETLERLSYNGIWLEERTGIPIDIIPYPAVFLVGSDGKVIRHFTAPGGALTLSEGEVLKAAQALATKERSTLPPLESSENSPPPNSPFPANP